MPRSSKQLNADKAHGGASARTLEMLRCIALGERDFALKDLAERACLAPSTVHRFLELWVQRDLLERAGPKSYRLGPELFRLSSLIVQKFEINRVARSWLENLWSEWQETVSFCLYNPSRHTATVADSIASPHPLQLVLAPYAELSLVWGSLGRSILAQLPGPAIESVMARDPTGPLSGSPLPPRRLIDAELALVRARGYALYEDPSLNIAGVSAPIFGVAGKIVGSIGVTMPSTRFKRPIKEKLPKSVVTSARSLSVNLGSS